MRRLVLLTPTPVRGHVLPWKTDVLPPQNYERYAQKIRTIEASSGRTIEVAMPPDYIADANRMDPPRPVSRPLVDVMADALGLSKGKTRKAIQAGKALVRGSDGGERQVHDPDYRLGVGETARLDG